MSELRILAHIFLLSCFNHGCSGLAPSPPGLSTVTLPPGRAPGQGDTRPPQAAAVRTPDLGRHRRAGAARTPAART